MKDKGVSSFFGGVAVLTASAVIVKIIGVCYKIPLVHLLGTQGMGYFNAAYDVYALLCIISTTGLPVAVSVMMNQYKGQHKRIFLLSLYAFLSVGVLGAAFVFAFSDHIAALIGAPEAAISLRFISPAVLFICLTGALRGYYQGKRNMLPTAVSQIIEAASKLVFGLIFAYIAFMQGQKSEKLAAAAVLGLSIGTFLCFLYLLLCGNKDFSNDQPGQAANGELFKKIIALAFPITLGAALSGLTKMIDLVLIMRRLQDAGLDQDRSVALYGCYSAMVVPIYSAVPALFGSVAMPLIPHLSHAIGNKDASKQRSLIESSIRLTALISIPCAVGIGMLSKHILQLLFRNSADVPTAVPLLLFISMAIPAGCLITLTNAILQAYHHPWLPMLSTAIGCIFKALTLYTLSAVPSVGIMAAPISTLICCVVIVFLNLVFMIKITPVFSFAFPWISGICISAVSIGVAGILKRIMQRFAPSEFVVVMMTVAVSATVYFVLAYTLGLFRVSDIKLNKVKGNE